MPKNSPSRPDRRGPRFTGPPCGCQVIGFHHEPCQVSKPVKGTPCRCGTLDLEAREHLAKEHRSCPCPMSHDPLAGDL